MVEREEKRATESRNEKSDATLNEAQVDSNHHNMLREAYGKLSWLRALTANTCGLDYNIEDDVIVAGSGLMDTVREMINFNDAKATLETDKSGEKLSLALFRLFVERFMPAASGSILSTPPNLRPSSETCSTKNATGTTLLTTALQSKIVALLGDLLEVYTSFFKDEGLGPDSAGMHNTCVSGSRRKERNIDVDLITVMGGNPLSIFDGRKKGGNVSSLTSYHTVSFDLLLLDPPAASSAGQDCYFGLFSKGISDAPRGCLKESNKNGSNSSLATQIKRARNNTSKGYTATESNSRANNKECGVYAPCQNFGVRLKQDTHELEVFFMKELSPEENFEPKVEVVTKTVAGRLPVGRWCRVIFVLEKCVSKIYINGNLEAKGDIQDSSIRSFIRGSKANEPLNCGPVCLGKAAYCSYSRKQQPLSTLQIIQTSLMIMLFQDIWPMYKLIHVPLGKEVKKAGFLLQIPL